MRVKQLLAGALAKPPEKRPTAQAFATETAALLAGLGAPLPARERWLMRLEQSSRLPITKRRWVGLASILIGVALLFWIAVVAQREGIVIGIAVPVRQSAVHITATADLISSVASEGEPSCGYAN